MKTLHEYAAKSILEMRKLSERIGSSSSPEAVTLNLIIAELVLLTSKTIASFSEKIDNLEKAIRNNNLH